jgi:hypothetical protein
MNSFPWRSGISENPILISLKDVEVGKNYAIIITTNGGLWRYKIGDTVSNSPRLCLTDFKISGRTKHFINAFGEEVIVENAEAAIEYACEMTGSTLMNFSAAPVYLEGGGSKGAHEWIIEFRKPPESLSEFTSLLDKKLKAVNSDYEAKRHKDLALKMPIVHLAPEGLFEAWLAKKGKLGGQYKVPRLYNSREYLDEILEMMHPIS